jgi:hypothetical protein
VLDFFYSLTSVSPPLVPGGGHTRARGGPNSDKGAAAMHPSMEKCALSCCYFLIFFKSFFNGMVADAPAKYILLLFRRYYE